MPFITSGFGEQTARLFQACRSLGSAKRQTPHGEQRPNPTRGPAAKPTPNPARASSRDPPTVEPAFLETRQGLNRPVVMTCRVLRAHPSRVLRFEWLLSNRLLHAGAFTEHKDETEYTVRSLNRDGWGEYTCNVINEAGTGKCTFHVTDGHSSSLYSSSSSPTTSSPQLLSDHLHCHPFSIPSAGTQQSLLSLSTASLSTTANTTTTTTTETIMAVLLPPLHRVLLALMCCVCLLARLATPIPLPTDTPTCTAAGDAHYSLTFTGKWTQAAFPKQYPIFRPPAQWSTLIGVSHSADYHMWRQDDFASNGVREFTEKAEAWMLMKEVEEAGQRIQSTLGVFSAPAMPGGSGQTSAEFEVFARNSYLSFMVRIVPSPDWFVGMDSLDLCEGEQWKESITLELFPYDAGTDSGFTFSSPNYETIPQDKVMQITSSFPSHPANSFFYPRLKSLPPIAKLLSDHLHCHPFSIPSAGTQQSLLSLSTASLSTTANTTTTTTTTTTTETIMAVLLHPLHRVLLALMCCVCPPGTPRHTHTPPHRHAHVHGRRGRALQPHVHRQVDPSRFPKQYPIFRPPAQWSTLIGVSHSADYHMWRQDDFASNGVREFTEKAEAWMLMKEVEEAGQRIQSTLGSSPPPAMPGGSGQTSAEFEVFARNSYLSFMVRIVPSPDWFVGMDSLDLCEAASPSPHPTMETIPQDKVMQITSSFPSHPANSFFYPRLKSLPPIAKVTLTKIKKTNQIISLPVEPTQSNQLPTDNEIEEKHIKTPLDCEVSAWSPWGLCKGKCGDSGVRHRTRYVMMQSANHGAVCPLLEEEKKCTPENCL
ncbi:hypothetical protein CRUP_035193 [Coryphaenoides rupestris]|nr:hypothetical protein CRUP_035193 [Coryphaenoides rupestris]